MPTKSEKRRSERIRDEKKKREDALKNPTEEVVCSAEGYCTYQCMYMNDATLNACKVLIENLKKVKYNGNGAKKLCGALDKRIHAYFDAIYRSGGDEWNSISTLFSYIDEYVDPCIAELKDSIRRLFDEVGIRNAEWVASVETAHTLCSYSIQCAEEYYKKLLPISKSAATLKYLQMTEVKRILDSLCEFVTVAEHIDMNIDLNKNAAVVEAFDKLNRRFLKPQHFSVAVEKTNKECDENGWTRVL